MKIQEIKIKDIMVDEDTLRDYADPHKLMELKQSMYTFGLLQPIVVKKEGENYKLIAGLRRTIAAKELGWETIPAYVIEGTDEIEDDLMTLEENIKREEISPVQEGRWYKRLMAKGITMEEIANMIGKSVSYIQQRVELTEAEKDLQDAVERGDISFSVAREIMGIKNIEHREYIKDLAIRTGANVQQVREWKKSLEEDHRMKNMTVEEYEKLEAEKEERIPTFFCPVCRQEHEVGTGIAIILCPDCYRIVIDELRKG